MHWRHHWLPVLIHDHSSENRTPEVVFRNETEWNLSRFTCICFMVISLCGNWELQGQQQRVNHRKQQRILGRSMHIYHSVTGYMSRSLRRWISELSCRFYHLNRPCSNWKKSMTRINISLSWDNARRIIGSKKWIVWTDPKTEKKLIENHKNATLLKVLKLQLFDEGIWWNFEDRQWISVSCGSYNLVYLEGFPFWNSTVLWREFSSRYQTPHDLLLLDWHKHKDCDNFIFSSFAFYIHTP